MVDRSVLSHEDARKFYDRFGSSQDLQWFYEDPAIRALIARASFPQAGAIVEFGCGTGRVAEMLLREHLSHSATYLAMDSSATMVALTRERLAPFGDRARVVQTDGSPSLSEASASCDRFVSTYVLDLLSMADIQQVLTEAHRLLTPDGRLALVGLTHGATFLARLVERLWTFGYRLRPSIVGGCRPISLLGLLGTDWHVLHSTVVTSFGISSEVVVAEKHSITSGYS